MGFASANNDSANIVSANIVSANNEYLPKALGNHPTVHTMVSFQASSVTVTQLANRNREAVQLMQQAGWK